MTWEFKDFKPELKALDDQGKGQAIIATLNTVDHDGDVTVPRAFGEQFVKLLVAHNWNEPPVGDARLYESGSQVLADFELNLNMEKGRELYEYLKWDAARHRLAEWSYGFRVLDHDRGTHDGKAVRFLKKVKAWEISPVVVGAGVGTGTMQVKSALTPPPAVAYPSTRTKEASPMQPRDHLMDALTSMRAGRRQIQLMQRLLERDAPTIKQTRMREYVEAALDDFDTALEHLDPVTDVLDGFTPAAPVSPLATLRPKLAEVAEETAERPEPAPPPPDEPEDDSEEEDEKAPAEKGGKPSLKTDLEHLVAATRDVLPHLEAMKRVRTAQGRPMSTERLSQVDQFMGDLQDLLTRLSALKGQDELQRQQAADQQELHALAERFKRLGVTA